MTQEVDEVLAAVGKRGAAMVAGDVEAIAGLLDARCIYTHSSGLTDTRESYLAALNRNEYTYHSVELVQLDHALVLGESVILNSVMAVAMTVRSTGQSLSRQIKLTETWVRAPDGSGWRLLVSHSTNSA